MLADAKITAEYPNVLSGFATTENSQEVNDLRNKVMQLELALKLLQEASGYHVEAPRQRNHQDPVSDLTQMQPCKS